MVTPFSDDLILRLVQEKWVQRQEAWRAAHPWTWVGDESTDWEICNQRVYVPCNHEVRLPMDRDAYTCIHCNTEVSGIEVRNRYHGQDQH